jgi:hypothetical protein
MAIITTGPARARTILKIIKEATIELAESAYVAMENFYANDEFELYTRSTKVINGFLHSDGNYVIIVEVSYPETNLDWVPTIPPEL